MSARATASVVIPAHDEGQRIGRTLDALRAGDELFDIVVVCNGCSDDTADVARAAGVTVAEIPLPSKAAALRCGDQLTEVFPRLYLDADVVLSGEAAAALARALDRRGPAVASVVPRIDLAGSSRMVRWYFDFRQRLPVFRGGVIGAGVYAMNESGRALLGEWPDVVGDDQLVLRLFDASERVTVPGHHTVVTAPSDLRALLGRGVRVRRGNVQLPPSIGARPLPAPRTGFAVAAREAVVRPRRWAGLLTWVTVSAVIRLLSRTPRAVGDWGTAAVTGARRSPSLASRRP